MRFLYPVLSCVKALLSVTIKKNTRQLDSREINTHIKCFLRPQIKQSWNEMENRKKMHKFLFSFNSS